jgi:hypothetical protein
MRSPARFSSAGWLTVRRADRPDNPTPRIGARSRTRGRQGRARPSVYAACVLADNSAPRASADNPNRPAPLAGNRRGASPHNPRRPAQWLVVRGRASANNPSRGRCHGRGRRRASPHNPRRPAQWPIIGAAHRPTIRGGRAFADNPGRRTRQRSATRIARDPQTAHWHTICTHPCASGDVIGGTLSGEGGGLRTPPGWGVEA